VIRESLKEVRYASLYAIAIERLQAPPATTRAIHMHISYTEAL
jgi:hypothetical protein